MRSIACVAMLILIGGCTQRPLRDRSPADAEMFGPTSVHIHPIFTQAKDWTGDNKPDGIEVLVELRDQFDEPTKATGRMLFELFDYRTGSPDTRGERLVNPWIGSIRTIEEQRERWSRTFRTYRFQLDYDDISANRNYVLSVMFQGTDGMRLFDRIILEPAQRPPDWDLTPPAKPPDVATTRPTTAPLFPPTTRPTTGPLFPPATREATTQELNLERPSTIPFSGPSPRSPEP